MIYELSMILCTGLSVLSSLILIGYYFFQQKARTLAFSLVLPIFLYDFLLFFDYFIPLIIYFINPDTVISKPLCMLQGQLKLFRTNGTLFSTLAICWTLYSFFIKKKPLKFKNQPIFYFSPFTFVLPLLISVIPLTNDRYSNANPLSQVMCIIIFLKYPNGEVDYFGIIQKLILSYVPFLGTIILQIYIIVRIFIHFRKNDQVIDINEIKYLILYPLFLALSQVWILYQRFYEMVTNGNQIDWLNTFDLQMVQINGFMNAIIYGVLSLRTCFLKSNSNTVSEQDYEEQNNSGENQSFSIQDSMIE
ncbi:hypothetical protein ABPG72_015242 [Tetrahymena utriculariae]